MFYQYVEYKKPEDALPNYFHYFFNRLKVGLVTTICGSQFLKSGCGKSFSALKVGELVDPDFHIGKVVYYPREFLTVMDEVEATGKPSQVIVTDEGEITAPATLWYSFTNRAIAYNLATFRYLRSMSIFVTPSFAWLDSRVRTLTSHLAMCEKVHSANVVSVNMRFYQITTNIFGDKIYLRKIHLFDSTNHVITKMNSFKMSLPSEQLIIEYEKKSLEFKKTLRGGLVKEIDKFERYQSQKFGEDKVDLKDIVEKAIENPVIKEDLMKMNKVSAVTVRTEMDEYNLSYWESARLSKMIRKMWNGRK